MAIVGCLAASALALGACGSDDASSGGSGGGDRASVKVQLTWYPQSQFAGYYVAKEKGWYDDVNLDVDILPGGPNTGNPVPRMLAGQIHFADMNPAKIISNRTRGADLKDVYQLMQTSQQAYVAKKDSGIESVEDMKGRRVGLWFGGAQFEFLAMLDSAGIGEDELELVPQAATIVPWLEDKYEVMQVAPFNELNLAANEVGLENMNVITCADVEDACLQGQGIAAADTFLEEQPEVAQRFLDATARGWAYAVENPEETAEIVVKAAPTLKVDDQVAQMRGMIDTICSGATLNPDEGLGYIDPAQQQLSYDIMESSDQLGDSEVAIDEAYTTTFWDKIPEEYKHPKCAEGNGLEL